MAKGDEKQAIKTVKMNRSSKKCGKIREMYSIHFQFPVPTSGWQPPSKLIGSIVGRDSWRFPFGDCSPMVNGLNFKP